MFFSSVHADDDLKRYPAAIQKAIEYAKNTDFSALEDGRQVYSFLGNGYKKPYFSINSICLSISPLGMASSLPRMFFSCRLPAAPVMFKPSFGA